MAAETTPAPTPVLQRCRTANCPNRQEGQFCDDHARPTEAPSKAASPKAAKTEEATS